MFIMFAFYCVLIREWSGGGGGATKNTTASNPSLVSSFIVCIFEFFSLAFAVVAETRSNIPYAHMCVCVSVSGLPPSSSFHSQLLLETLGEF